MKEIQCGGFLCDVCSVAEGMYEIHWGPCIVPNIEYKDGVNLSFFWSSECSNRRELCIAMEWHDYDDEGDEIKHWIQFPCRYLYEDDWRDQEYDFMEAEKAKRQAKVQQQKEYDENKERELYERLKIKYEKNIIAEL